MSVLPISSWFAIISVLGRVHGTQPGETTARVSGASFGIGKGTVSSHAELGKNVACSRPERARRI